jgi:hypothetical protein
MKDRHPLTQISALATATAIALLVLVGTYTALANSVPPDGPDLVSPAATSSNGPTSWDSGWQYVIPSSSREFTHGLGHAPEEYAVEMWFRDLDDDL